MKVAMRTLGKEAKSDAKEIHDRVRADYLFENRFENRCRTVSNGGSCSSIEKDEDHTDTKCYSLLFSIVGRMFDGRYLSK